MASNGDSHWDAETPVLGQGELKIAPVDKNIPSEAPPDNELIDDDSISYEYLTWDSTLPVPRTPQEAGLQDDVQLPPCPDLTYYTSPLTWSLSRKYLLLGLSCIATFLTAYTAGAYSPPATLIAKDLGSSHLAVLAGITTFCMGFAIAPMALAPLSEILGRYPVFVAAGAIYVLFQAVCSVMTNIAGMLIARFFVGVGGSVFSSVVGGVLADLWDKEERNTPMSLFSGFVLGGTGAGPLVSAAFIAGMSNGTRAWKWTFWLQVILDGILVIALIFLFRETRGSVLLSRKAKKLNKWYEGLEAVGVRGVWWTEQDVEPSATSSSSTFKTLQGGQPEGESSYWPEQGSRRRLRRIRWVVEADEQRASLATMVATSVKRPFFLLFTEPVVFCFSLWAAFSWGVLYLSFAVVPYLYASNINMSSRVYIAMIASAVVATVVGCLQERLLQHPQWKKQEVGDKPQSSHRFWVFMRKHFPAEAPESRLYFACITALLLPAGLFGAFLAPESARGYSIAVGIGFANWGIYSVYLATFNYLADTYHIYASSALAAQSFCRNVLGGSFPLLTAIMFNNLGLRNAGCLLGGIATGLTLIPWVLVFFGEKIRSRSKFAIVSCFD
ncbi:major facilitator superfamily domain-containing protein [Mariannaea sp. PMI_226]|nr:major facilitator superfamily domain-containing protein [Mariannaea sp. PMI_226]